MSFKIILKKLQTFDSSYLKGKSNFEEDGVQHYLVFQQIRWYFEIIAKTKYISSWKSKGLSDETIKRYATSDNSLTPLTDHYGSKVREKFNKGCLKQSNILTYDYGSIVNIYTVYELGASSSNDRDIEKYGYSGYGTGFYRRGSFSFPGGGFGQSVLIFGVDMSSSIYIDNKKKTY